VHLLNLTVLVLLVSEPPETPAKHSQSPDRPSATEKEVAITGRTCPDLSFTNTLCNMVSVRYRDEDPDSPNEYLYQTYIQKAACADAKKENEEEVRKKIQKLWESSADKLICDESAFGVPKGNLLKFGVDRYNTDFIDDVTENWKVDLNRIDPADNKTVMDYVEDKLKRLPPNSSLKYRLEQYHRKLRIAGAKYRHELFLEGALAGINLGCPVDQLTSKQLGHTVHGQKFPSPESTRTLYEVSGCERRAVLAVECDSSRCTAARDADAKRPQR